MTYRSLTVACTLSLAALAAFAALYVPACGSCNCPNSGGGVTQVQIPGAQSSPVEDAVSDNSMCTVSGTGGDSVGVQAHGSGTCSINVRLANGDTYAFSLVFQATVIHGACDCDQMTVSIQSGPTLVSTGDGGTD
jgi:hypothetical protein